MKFLGKTPLTEAVRQAASTLKSTEAKATVILITDGIETCEADPCALGAELEASGVDFTAHVVGFGLTAEEGCDRRLSGRKHRRQVYSGQGRRQPGRGAEDHRRRRRTGTGTSACARAGTRRPRRKRRSDHVLLVAGSGTEPEADILKDAYFEFFVLAADGAVAADTAGTIYGAQKGANFPARDKYQMRTTLHEAVVSQDGRNRRRHRPDAANSRIHGRRRP